MVLFSFIILKCPGVFWQLRVIFCRFNDRASGCGIIKHSLVLPVFFNTCSVIEILFVMQQFDSVVQSELCIAVLRVRLMSATIVTEGEVQII